MQYYKPKIIKKKIVYSFFKDRVQLMWLSFKSHILK